MDIETDPIIIESTEPAEEVKIVEEPTKPTDKMEKAAYIIGGSILVSAILISGTIFYNARMVLRYLDSTLPNVLSSISTGSAGQGGTQTTGTAAAPTPANPAKIVLKPNTPYEGNANAKVTVVEFADYQCPFCEQFYKTIWPQLKSAYVDTGKIKFVYQDFAFLGSDSNVSAMAAHCAADQNKFWQYHDYLFSNQGQENSGWATADHQKQFAVSVGLNTSQFNQCLDSHKYNQEVTDETAAGKSYGVNGTPTVFVNGVPFVGVQPYATFQQAIDKALAQ